MSQDLNFLSSTFLAPYEGRTPANAGRLFWPVFLRTYSRYIPELKRRERWDEAVARAVNYSIGLYQGPAPKEDLIREAEELYDKVFNLEVLPAGRTLWVGGTESANKFPESQYNCSFRVIDGLEAFTDLFHLLLCGCGVGFRILPEDVAQLPEFCPKVNVVNEPYKTVYPYRKVDYTKFPHETDAGMLVGQPGHLGVDIYVGDSREAWVQALRLFLETSATAALMKEVKELTFNINYNFVRPEGSRIVQFGGRAPGPKGLMEMFTNLAKVITKAGGRLSPVDCMDICNFIGKNVIIGGTRRSSQVALGAPTDQEFIDAKKMLWLDKQNLQRTMSNNSIVFTERASKEQIKEIFAGIKVNGEPGFYNLSAGRKRHPYAQGSNPCMEIQMDNRGFCNLATVNLTAFVDETGFDLDAAKDAIRTATRVCLRMTNITVSLPEWDKIQKRDRLLGASITGLMDTFDALGIEFDSPEAIFFLKSLKKAANDEAQKYAFEMRIPTPLLVTTIKPEGTLSQLPTVSSGLHRGFAPYYIRRIRVSSMDPVASALKKLGVPYEADQAKSERLVFSFPIETKATKAASDEPARRQFERYLTTMKHYTDHNSSCTLTIGENEWTEIEDMVYDNWDDVVACAFLPKYTDAYPQMPYEEITKEQYEEMMKTFPNLDNLADLVNQYENEDYEDELIDDACSSGQCPVR